MAINKYLPFAILFFFFNSIGLPYGLTFMVLLCPFFYVWVVMKEKKEPLVPFLLILSPFILIHFSNQVNLKAYLVSITNVIGVYIFCWAFYVYAKNVRDWEKIFNKILYINFFLCLLAIPFYFTKYYGLFWIEQYLTEGINNFKRLRMFTYEASYYATLFTPIFYFYFLQGIFRMNSIHYLKLAVMILLPFVLSFSLGVMSTILITIIFLFLVYARFLIRKKRIFILVASGIGGLIGVTIVLLIFFPNNPLFIRIDNILAGLDSSGKGRTSDAFYLAREISSLKDENWGIGFGQLKIIGEDIIREFYNYDLDYVISIPNATAETLVVLGWIGLCLRLFIQISFFIYTRVWTNYYRFLMFLFVFIYQFTGSFITNQAEYVIWILAFTNVFPQFNVGMKHVKNLVSTNNTTLSPNT